jgi:hypothetical protein
MAVPVIWLYRYRTFCPNSPVQPELTAVQKGMITWCRNWKRRISGGLATGIVATSPLKKVFLSRFRNALKPQTARRDRFADASGMFIKQQYFNLQPSMHIFDTCLVAVESRSQNTEVRNDMVE